MLNSTLYAVRKRKRPTQKTKPDGVKSNSSKRHRARLNTELERLGEVLPFPKEVINKLDKLSVLRLSVSFLRAKSYFEVALQNRKSSDVENPPLSSSESVCTPTKLPQVPAETGISEGDLMLQALNGFVLVVTADGTIFYSSQTIQDYLGFHQSDIINQSVFKLIHTEDREKFRCQLRWACSPPSSATEEGAKEKDSANGGETLCPNSQPPPANSDVLDRSFECRFRCLLDNVSGFLALHFHGRLKFLHGQNRSENGSPLPPQLALFAIATPVQPQTLLEIRTTSRWFRTKHKLDYTTLSCDTKTSLVLGWTEAELQMHSGYQFIHYEDLAHCAENHLRMMKTGYTGVTICRLLCKDNRWQWIQAIAWLVYKDGQPDYVVSNQRTLSDAEGEEHLQKRMSQASRFMLSESASLYECSNGISPQPQVHTRLRTVEMDHRKIQEQSSSKATEKAVKGLGGTENEPLTILTLPPVENTVEGNRKLPTNLCDGLLSDSSNEGAVELTGFPRSGKTSPVNSSPDVSPEGLEQMLQCYGLIPEDLELIHQDELIKHIELDNLKSELTSNSVSNECFPKNSSSYIGHSSSLVSEDWGYAQSSLRCSSNLDVSWTTTDDMSTSNQLLSPQHPQGIHYHLQSSPGPEASYLQIASMNYIPYITCSASHPILQLNIPGGKETQNFSTAKVDTTLTRLNICDSQTNWLNDSSPTNLMQPLCGEDAHKSDGGQPYRIPTQTGNRFHCSC